MLWRILVFYIGAIFLSAAVVPVVARVPVVAVPASVVFGTVTVVLELVFPEMVLGVLLNIVGSTCLLVWTSALLAQLALRLRADREGTELPLRMPGFPWLACLGLLILAVIFTVGSSVRIPVPSS